jgi:geranylgeranyl pyrophosphate synthase
VRILRRAWPLLWLSFQITDDLLNLFGDRARYGKEINGDL